MECAVRHLQTHSILAWKVVNKEERSIKIDMLEIHVYFLATSDLKATFSWNRIIGNKYYNHDLLSVRSSVKNISTIISVYLISCTYSEQLH